MKLKFGLDEKVRLGPYGIHVYNRKTGHNILINEIDIPCSKWTKVPRHMSIALTTDCDLNCPYCFSPKRHAELHYDRLIDWLDQLDVYGCFGVGFGGGEPTLYRKLPELCHYAANKTKLSITLTTHGHNLNNNLINNLMGNVHFIRISMDGVNGTYEKLRKRSFEKLINRIKDARKLAPFGINYLVNSDTIADLDDALSIAVNEGASELLLLPQQPTNGTKGIDIATKNRLIMWINNNKNKLQLSISEESKDLILTCNPTESEDSSLAFSHIDANGTLKLTSFDMDGVKIDNGGIIEAIGKLRKYFEGE